MVESSDTFLHKIWFLGIVILIAANIFLMLFDLSFTQASGYRGIANFTVLAGSKNAAAPRMRKASREFGHLADATGHVFFSGARGIAAVALQSVTFVSHGAEKGATFVGHGVASAPGFMIRGLGSMAGSVSRTAVVGNLIRPTDRMPAPVINLDGADMTAQVAAAPTANQALAPANTPPQWPIHGAITTLFGVPEFPYEPVHTGLDISNGARAGTTAVKPYRPGRVAQVIHSGEGLGDHVIIDHGSGVTSVYGHLSSVSVAPLQAVDENTVLGYEGTTGASTGTHLHFEIRINGVPVNPLDYISGRP